MKKITSIVVHYADGHQETITGEGHIRTVNTSQTVEFWPPDQPDLDKPRERTEKVCYVTIAMHPQEPATE